MPKNIFIRFCAYLLPLGVVFFYANLFGKIGMGGISCTFYKYTGLHCPGCGGQRAFKALLHGDIHTAASNNILIFILVPTLLYCYFILVETYWIKNSSWSSKFQIPSFFGYLLVVLLGVFFVLRNLPFHPFTHLVP